jgi:hypothetical protein
VPVHTAWDIGHRHSTAIWFFQVVGPEVRIIDFYDHGQYADHYCSVVSARGYLQGKDFVPHDARVHEWGTGKTRLETLIALGRKPVLVPEHKVESYGERYGDTEAIATARRSFARSERRSLNSTAMVAWFSKSRNSQKERYWAGEGQRIKSGALCPLSFAKWEGTGNSRAASRM